MRRTVDAYLDCLADLEDTFARLGSSPRALLREVNAGYRARRGLFRGEVEYEKHGSGFRARLSGGKGVEFDVHAAADVAFDPWRVRMFALELGADAPSESAIARVLETMSREGSIVRLGGSWYSVRRRSTG